jgi:hypothetical protein
MLKVFRGRAAPRRVFECVTVTVLDCGGNDEIEIVRLLYFSLPCGTLLSCEIIISVSLKAKYNSK